MTAGFFFERKKESPGALRRSGVFSSARFSDRGVPQQRSGGLLMLFVDEQEAGNEQYRRKQNSQHR
jgi:hypothetical protein